MTNKPRRSLELAIWGGIALTIAVIALSYIISQLRRDQRDPLLVLTSGLPPFALTNQFGQAVSAASLTNHVTVVNVIFTRCAGPCPEMTRQMAELQRIIPASLPVRLISVSTDPDNDSPAVLKRFAESFQADGARWWFLTGTKPDIARLAREGLRLVAQESSPKERAEGADLFIHSTVFVLLDRKGRLRGSIDSTEPDFQMRVLRAVRQLAREK